jgi:hypothetical protein
MFLVVLQPLHGAGTAKAVEGAGLLPGPYFSSETARA